jgi:hypothetical protein
LDRIFGFGKLGLDAGGFLVGMAVPKLDIRFISGWGSAISIFLLAGGALCLDRVLGFGKLGLDAGGFFVGMAVPKLHRICTPLLLPGSLR